MKIEKRMESCHQKLYPTSISQTKFNQENSHNAFRLNLRGLNNISSRGFLHQNIPKYLD